MRDETPYLWPYIGAQLFSLLFLWAAIAKPKLARFLFVVLFAGAALFNYVTASNDPQAYLNFASLAYTGYAHFILGWFKYHIYETVSLIALGQALIAIAFLLKGNWVKLGASGAVLFLLAIVPLGIGAAFPFPVTLSLAIFIMLKKDDMNFLWKFKKPTHDEY
jgi:hypothetical protein